MTQIERHRDKFRRVALNISHYRKKKGLTQEELADLAHISLGYLSHIEAPNLASSFSIAVLFDIADALEIDPKLLFDN